MNVYVGNLPSDVTGNDLREAFEPFGRVETARVVTHRHGGGSRGFGFVDMPARSEAVRAVLRPWNARSKMGIQYWSGDIILVNLPWKLQVHGELQRVMEMVRERGDCNVVVDFSSVDVVGGTTFTQLLKLRQVLQDSGHKLVLCGLSPATKGVFTIARLDSVFEFVEDRFAALAGVQMMP
jgi:anti-anti-sigma factor